MHPIYCAYLIIFWGLLNLDIITSTPPLDYLCLIWNSNRIHSFIFNLCIMIVNTLKMCTGDAGLEQSLVLLMSHIRDARLKWFKRESNQIRVTFALFTDETTSFTIVKSPLYCRKCVYNV